MPGVEHSGHSSMIDRFAPRTGDSGALCAQDAESRAVRMSRGSSIRSAASRRPVSNDSIGSTIRTGRGGVTWMRARELGVIPNDCIPSTTMRYVRLRTPLSGCRRFPPRGPAITCPSRSICSSISRSCAHASHSIANADWSSAVSSPRRSRSGAYCRQKARPPFVSQAGIFALPSSSAGTSASERRPDPAFCPLVECGFCKGPREPIMHP